MLLYPMFGRMLVSTADVHMTGFTRIIHAQKQTQSRITCKKMLYSRAIVRAHNVATIKDGRRKSNIPIIVGFNCNLSLLASSVFSSN